jgi:hypothetical protein
LPWTHNPVTGTRAGAEVLFGQDAAALVTLTLVAGVLLALSGLFATTRRWTAAAVGGSALALTVLGAMIPALTEAAHLIGRDAEGRLVEPDVPTTLGPGYYLAIAAVLISASAGLAALLRNPAAS